MPLTELPFELQLLILDQIKRENHLDLAPISQTCKHFASLVADRFNWTQTVTVVEPSHIASNAPSKLYMYRPLQKNGIHAKRLITTILQANVSGEPAISFVLSILRNQQRTSTLKGIHLLMPSKHHYKVYHALGKYPQTNLQELAIRDTTDDGYIMASTSSASQYHMLLLLQQFISKTLSESQSTLKRLELPSFPSTLLLAENALLFPQVSYLQVALTGHGQHYNDTWRRFKRMFPSLTELRLTLEKEHIALLRSLLQDVALFPWVKRLTIQSTECPKSYLSREELRNSLLQLHGLNRITAGWDMIALN
ncbi:hypothetical protein [Parasitella parasitica]|uniref:F-box domain-containing protein n=1 Tax=Parasitella parasitica TaxID=35722 RepID=A0A0B7MWI6_9FUNG|nr:hypothetical protein [Parasitella parasitica]